MALVIPHRRIYGDFPAGWLPEGFSIDQWWEDGGTSKREWTYVTTATGMTPLSFWRVSSKRYPTLARWATTICDDCDDSNFKRWLKRKECDQSTKGCNLAETENRQIACAKLKAVSSSRLESDLLTHHELHQLFRMFIFSHHRNNMFLIRYNLIKIYSSK